MKPLSNLKQQNLTRLREANEVVQDKASELNEVLTELKDAGDDLNRELDIVEQDLGPDSDEDFDLEDMEGGEVEDATDD